MITEHDVKRVEEIKAILEPMTRDGETGVHWKYVHMQETLDRLVNNLRIAHVSYCAASEEDIAEHYYTAECGKCGWWGSSKLLNGGGAIADTGDHFECTCPVCDNWDIGEKALQSIKVNCNHKPSRLPYLAWHDWADRKTRQGHIQKQCPKCKLWLFKCEM